MKKDTKKTSEKKEKKLHKRGVHSREMAIGTCVELEVSDDKYYAQFYLANQSKEAFK